MWRTDVRTRTVTATVEGLDPLAMAAGPDALWVLDAAGRVSRIDPITNTVVASIPIGSYSASRGGLAIGEGAVWVLDHKAGRVVRIDPTADRVMTTIPLELSPLDAVTTGGGSVWVTDQYRGAARRINAATNQITHTIPLWHSIELGRIEFAGGLVWVAIGEPLGR